MRETRRLRHLIARAALAAVAAAWLALPGAARDGQPAPRAAQAPAPGTASFAAQVAALSEPGGYFDTDNLISNERSYLQVVPDLARRDVSGGAYIGVGPDTNFSYIAAVRPSVALIVDVRRDNLLLHLLFKAIFQLSPTRAEYVSLLFGRQVPRGLAAWRRAPADRLVAHVARSPRAADPGALRRRVTQTIAGFGVPLSTEDLATIARFHDRFIAEGFALRFNSTGRAPRESYPTYGELVLETGADGRQHNYLASEEAFQFVRSLQARDRIIPVVGDLGGPSAVAAIGRMLAARRTPLSAFYASNVEFYLFADGTFPRFIENLRQLPRTGRSVVIRSVFGRYAGAGWGGAVSTSQLHTVDDLLSGVADGRYRSYGQLVAGR